jgi:glucose dehydrogenase
MLLLLALASLAADLTAETAPQLKVAWTYQTQAAPPSKKAAQVAAFEATPLFAEGLLYVITPFDQAIALDPATGREQWRYDPHVASDRDYSEASTRGVAVASGVVYFGTLDARLIALNAKSGKLVWQRTLGPPSNDGNYQVTSPPVARSLLTGAPRECQARGTAPARRVGRRQRAARTAWEPASGGPAPSGRTGRPTRTH